MLGGNRFQARRIPGAVGYEPDRPLEGTGPSQACSTLPEARRQLWNGQQF